MIRNTISMNRFVAMNKIMYRRSKYTISMNKSVGYVAPQKNKYKVLVIGGGHNGLVCGKSSSFYKLLLSLLLLCNSKALILLRKISIH